jgi:hypothetical protein
VRRGEVAWRRPSPSVMLAARLEHLDEDVTANVDAATAADVWSVGKTKLTTLTLGANAWFGPRLRATLDYAWNRLGGTTFYSSGITDRDVHELSLQLALAL